MQMETFCTERLILRPTREADGAACLDIWLDDEMGRYLADPPRALAAGAVSSFCIISAKSSKIKREIPFTNARKHAKIFVGFVNLPRRLPITPTAHFAGRRLPEGL